MRRPLFVVCLCLVVLAAWRGADTASPGTVPQIADGTPCIVTGRVYKKDNDYFYLTSIISEQESTNQQQNSINEKSSYEKSSHEKFLYEKFLYEKSLQEMSACETSLYEKSSYKNSFYENLMCEYDGEMPVLLGSTVRVSGTFDAFFAATNPGEFDMEEYYHSMDIGGKLREVTILDAGEEYSRWQETLFQIKRYFRARLYTVFPEKEASVMSAMLLGDKSELDEEVKTLYQSNGIVHILSISGLHITIIGMGIYRMLRKFGLPVYPSAICAGGILLLYGVMTGMSVSACRAIGMYLIRMLAELVGRTYDMLTALGLMVAIMVWNNPGNLQNAGFYLSFCAVLGIGLVYPALLPAGQGKDVVLKFEENGRKHRYKQRFREWGIQFGDGLKQSIFSGASVTLITLPIQLWFYYEVPTYSVFINLFVLPFMSLVMICGIVAMLIPGLGIIGTVDCLVLKGYELLCQGFEKLPFHTWNPGRPQVWQMVVYYVLLLGVVATRYVWRARVEQEDVLRVRVEQEDVLRGNSRMGQSIMRACRNHVEKYSTIFCGGIVAWKGKIINSENINGKRNPVWVQIILLTIAVMILGLPTQRETTVTFLDVGQGDCICVQTASGEVYLFDCGSSSRSKVGQYVLKPYLKYMGISHIDAVFVSHSDSDHYNGVEELQIYGKEWGITVDEWIMPGDIYAGASWQSGEVSFTCLNPPIGSGGDRVFEGDWEKNLKSGMTRDSESNTASGMASDVVKGMENNVADSNELSQCFYLEIDGKWSLLLTGDVEGEGEEYVLQELQDRGIENIAILKVAHHGSKYSTSETFLDTVQPRVAVISCGADNSYGHPHEETLERLESSGATILTTPECGAIMVVVGENMEVRSWRNPTE